MIIDRFEGDFAVVENDDETHSNVERTLLPAEAKEGDCLTLTTSGYAIDEEETARRRAAAIERMKRLRGKKQ